MPVLHLTDIAVRALKPSDKNETYWDDATPCFGVRVGKVTKTWIVMRGRKRERIAIGKYGELSLADARAAAKRLLSTAPEPKAIALTFATARARFLEENYREAKPRTRDEATRLLSKHFKSLEAQVLGEIDDADISKALGKLASTPSEQLHAFRSIRAFFRWCTKPPRRYIKHSPMEGYEPPSTDRKGTRVLTDDELKAVWKAAGAAPHAIVRLLILWGTRPSETTVLERSWTFGDVVTIPGEHTKNGRDHGIPICSTAHETLDLFQGNERYYFRARWGEGQLTYSGIAKIAREVQKASNTSGWSIRDLRRTFRSNMARLKVPRELCEVLINHAPPVLDEIYDRYDRLDEKREALAKYENFIHTLVARD